MTDALEGTAPPKPSLREQANSPRIGRARFLGNAVGFAILIAAIEIGLTFAGLKETRTLGEATITTPNHWVSLAGSVLLLLALIDLAVRRRHDREQNGADCVALLVLLEIIYVGSLFGELASVPEIAIAVVAGLALLYLLVALAILAGNGGPNRYGEPPRHD